MPGTPIDTYFLPSGDTPYRKPGSPALQPTPFLLKVVLIGPQLNDFLQRKFIIKVF